MMINLSSLVYVVLTEDGLTHFRNTRAAFNKEYGTNIPIEPKLDARGYYVCELWSLFKEFADAIALDRDTPFENNAIHIDKEV